MAFESVRTIKTIKEEMKTYQMARHSGLRAYEETSVLTTMNEAMAKEIQELEIKGQESEIDRDIYRATGEKLEYLVKDRLPAGRLPGAKAVGQIQFSRNTPALREYIIPAGTLVYAPGVIEVVVFETTVEAKISIGDQSILVPAVAQEAGLLGNVDSFSVTVIPRPPAGVERVTNPLPFAGGTDPEDDDSLRLRYLLATSLNGKATKQMLEEHLIALTDDNGDPLVREAQTFPAGPGELVIILDATEQTEMPLAIVDCIKENIAIGPVARGLYAAHFDGEIIEPNLGTSRGGKLFLRSRSNFINSYEVTIYYHDQLYRDRTTVAVTPQVFLKGDVMEVNLQDASDLVTVITGGINPAPGEFDLLVGYGEYPYLYNLPEKVAIDTYLQIYFTATPEAGLLDKIKESIRHFLDSFKIGERFEYSDLYTAVLIDHATGVPFIGIQEIKYLKAQGKGQNCDANGQRILLDNDERIDPGVITIEVMEE
jgi:hypothetical protein